MKNSFLQFFFRKLDKTYRFHNSFGWEKNCDLHLEDQHYRTGQKIIVFANESFHASTLEPEWVAPDNLIPEASLLLHSVVFTAPLRSNFKRIAIRFEFCNKWILFINIKYILQNLNHVITVLITLIVKNYFKIIWKFKHYSIKKFSFIIIISRTT